MNPNKALWEKGDFTRIAASMRDSGEELVDRLGITKGLEVLDLGCGDGTTARPGGPARRRRAGRRHRRATSSRPGTAGPRTRASTNLRSRRATRPTWPSCDDDRFDLVVSVFGAMFAPRPFDVAKEMVRVTRPGGRIVMGNWIPGDPTLVAQILKISSAYSPPPPEGFVSPMTWGVEGDVVERFAAAGVPAEQISCDRDTFVFKPRRRRRSSSRLFRAYYGPTMNAFEAAEANGGPTSCSASSRCCSRRRTRPDGGATSIPATYLRVTVEV